MDGFFIVGIDLALSSKVPSVPQLLQGYNGDGTPLLYSTALNFKADEKKTFIFRKIPEFT